METSREYLGTQSNRGSSPGRLVATEVKSYNVRPRQMVNKTSCAAAWGGEDLLLTCSVQRTYAAIFPVASLGNNTRRQEINIELRKAAHAERSHRKAVSSFDKHRAYNSLQKTLYQHI
jgi:hypothetical protein